MAKLGIRGNGAASANVSGVNRVALRQIPNQAYEDLIVYLKARFNVTTEDDALMNLSAYVVDNIIADMTAWKRQQAALAAEAAIAQPTSTADPIST